MAEIMGLVELTGAIAGIMGAIVFLVVLVGGGISFIRDRPGFRHPVDFLWP
ncbi:hypothetical protein AB4037_17085 [Labrys sp. KB_33_2]|uniref:hypothetical protein n=1 Tax=Labrys sp. KB_33_2 TaxID=3237479 RepID=UPI003F8FA03F